MGALLHTGFFPSEGSKALKYCLSSAPMHPPERGITLFAVAQFPPTGTVPEPGTGPAEQAHPWEPHTPLRQPPAPLWVQAPPSCEVSPFHPAGFGDRPSALGGANPPAPVPRSLGER